MRFSDNISIKPTHEPSVTIIILHHCGLKMLHQCLESVFKTRYTDFSVVIVDNGSTDGSIEFVKRVYGNAVKIIRSEVNLGFVAGNNLAFRQVKSKYVVLLNNDTVVDPKWLKSLVNVAESDPSIGACQPKLLSSRNPRYFDYNGACGGMLDVFGVPLCRGRVFNLIERDDGQYDTPTEIFWASGAAMFLCTKVARDAGLLDEILHAHMEEIDLSWRIRLLGYKVVCVPKSVVYHLGGGTPLSEKEKFYLKHRNNLIVILKNYATSSILHFFPLRIVLDLSSFVYFLMKGEKDRAFCIPKAYVWLLHKIGQIYRIRVQVQKMRKVVEKEMLNRMVRKSVAIQHFLLKRKYFFQLDGLPKLDYEVTPS